MIYYKLNRHILAGVSVIAFRGEKDAIKLHEVN